MTDDEDQSEGEVSDKKIAPPPSMRERLFDINMIVIYAGLSIGAVFVSINFVVSVVETFQKLHGG